jgi:hypothetical protein
MYHLIMWHIAAEIFWVKWTNYFAVLKMGEYMTSRGHHPCEYLRKYVSEFWWRSCESLIPYHKIPGTQLLVTIWGVELSQQSRQSPPSLRPGIHHFWMVYILFRLFCSQFTVRILYNFVQIGSHASRTPLSITNFGRGHASPGRLSNWFIGLKKASKCALLSPKPPKNVFLHFQLATEQIFREI